MEIPEILSTSGWLYIYIYLHCIYIYIYVCVCVLATRAHTSLPLPYRGEGQLEVLHSRQAKRVEEEPKELGRAVEGEPLRLGEQHPLPPDKHHGFMVDAFVLMCLHDKDL